MKNKRRYLAPVLLALLPGCRSGNAPVAEQSGKDIYLARCAICHGVNREGGGASMFPPLAGSKWVDGTPNPLAAIVLDGMQGQNGNFKAVMPGWGTVLPDADIASVITWLRQQDGKSPIDAVTVNHTRIVTNGHNTFWSVEDLQNLPAN